MVDVPQVQVPEIIGRTRPDGTVEVDPQFRVWFQNQLTGVGGVTPVGSILSGLNSTVAKTDGLIAGTQAVADVVIEGRGSLATEQDAQASNIENAGGALSVTADVAFVYGQSLAQSGQIITNTVTLAPSGGTAPYSVFWARKSGDVFTISAPTSLTTSFVGDPGQNGGLSGVYEATVTDASAPALTQKISISASVFRADLTL